MINIFQPYKTWMLRSILTLFFFAVPQIISLPAYAQCANPTGALGDIIYNTAHDVFQGCVPSGWVGFTQVDNPLSPPIPPSGCPTIGNVCSNGVIYAGDLNGNKLYIAANDAPTTLQWDSSVNWPPESNLTGGPLCTSPFTGTTCINGRDNTTFLNAHPDGDYPAAEYCAGLSAHGYAAGWYLPSRNELGVVYTNLKSGQPSGTFNLLNAYYWTSSESDGQFSYRQDMGPGWQDAPNKDNFERVRCMWRY